MALDKNDFPNINELAQIQRVRNLGKLYDGQQQDVLGLHSKISSQFKNEGDIPYIPFPFPARIADFYGDYIQGDPEKLQFIATEESGQERLDEVIKANNFESEVQNLGTRQSTYGYTVLSTYIEENNIRFQVISNDQYLPQPDGSIILVTYFKVEDEMYMLTRHYQYSDGGIVYIDRELFSAKGDGTVKEKMAGLDIANKYFGRIFEEQENLGTNIIPIVQINNQSPNNHDYPKSDFDDITPQLAEINERSTHIATQLLKNLDARIAVPDVPGIRDDDGNEKSWDTLFMKDDSKYPKYILNDNPLIPEAREYMMLQIKVISDSTGVPMFQLVKDGAMPDTVYGMKVKHWDADRKARTKRQNIADGVDRIVKAGFALKGEDFKGDVRMNFSSILPTNDTELVKKESTKVGAGLSSKVSAIMRIENMTEGEAEDEVNRIKDENRIAGVSDTNNPPQF
jgi:hypothetical protein